MITIIDYGMGNLKSIQNIVQKVDGEAIISHDVNEIMHADKLILPGIGTFDNGMKNLTERGLIPVLQKKVMQEKIPFLGICPGMQLITRKSEEGDLKGLGWIDADTIKFKSLNSIHIIDLWNLYSKIIKKNKYYALGNHLQK